MPIHLPMLQSFALTMMVLVVTGASSQAYPSKPIRILTLAPGSGGDLAGRIIAQGISGPLGQQVVVENRSGYLPQQLVQQSPPDGYTLLLSGGNFWNAPLLQPVSYDPVKDFSPITLATRAPNVLLVHPSLPAKTVKELIALAKAKPGELNYTSTTIGGTSHLTAELFKSLAGVNIVRVGYSTGTQEMADLLSGQVHITFNNAGAVMSHLKSGKLRALGVTSAQPSPVLPGVPTVAATLPGFEAESRSAIFAPAKTPGQIISRLNQEITRFVKTPEAKERFLGMGVEAVGSSPEELEIAVKSEMVRLGKVIKEAGIKPQ